VFTRKVYLALFALGLIILSFRVLVYFTSRPQTGGIIKVEGLVSSEPIIKKDKISFRLGKYWVYSQDEDISIGDKVLVSGKVDRGKLTAETLEKQDGKGFLNSTIRFKQALISRINKYLPNKESSLLAGVVLGSQEGLSREIKDQLIATGTLHIVVVSGYNIVLVASFFLALAKFLGRKKTTLLAVCAITVYSLLVGLEAPTLRALLMGLISLLAVLFGRQSGALYSLILASFLMIVLNPANLVDISFQLTVSATLGIIVFTRFFLKIFAKVPVFFRETLSSTLSAQILVVPLLFYYFGNISFMAPLVNVLVLWVIPFVTLTGFVLLLFSFASDFVTSLISTVVYLPLKYFFLIIGSFSRLDFLLLRFSEPNWLVVGGYYFLIISFVLRYRRFLFSKNSDEENDEKTH